MTPAQPSRWQDDPALAGRGLLQRGLLAGWDGCAPTVGDRPAARELAHRPGGRATLLLQRRGPADAGEHDPGSSEVAEQPGGCILKLYSAAQFPAAVAVARAAARHDGLAPRVLGVHYSARALHIERATGVPLDQADPARRQQALDLLGGLIARVHAKPPVQLPPWDALHAVRKLDRWRLRAASVDPASATRARAVVMRLAESFAGIRAGGVGLHGDLSLRNILYDQVRGTVRLVDWDRAARGPAEVDLAPLVGLLGEATERMVNDYRAAGGMVAQDLLADLVLANRLTRALRRLARGEDPVGVGSARVAGLVEGHVPTSR
ncbi:MAG TPA: phosphotransferase [Dermatophilaceae bacterium]|nr:phosphotransferase [Dermatophilaceae bacterium]